MDKIIGSLKKLQDKIHSQNLSDGSEYLQETFTFCESNELLKIHFYGSDSFYNVLEILTYPQIAEKVKSLNFDCPDEGVNGTINYDFTALTTGNTVFPNLTDFVVKLTQLEDHNRTIIGEIYEENGLIGQLVKKMPKLLNLKIPSAPNAEFFKLKNHPLEFLTLQVGYDTENFILNFSEAKSYPNLRYLDFSDYQETYMKNWQEYCTPFEHFKKLFGSESFKSIKVLILRNVIYSDAQLDELKSVRTDLQIIVIKTESRYL